jgi:glycosyltransferase involved in cell wall biosynthesis
MSARPQAIAESTATTVANGALRIVDVINLSSSAQTLLRERVLALRARGVDNHIVCIDGPYVPSLRAAGIPVGTVHLPRGMNPAKALWSLCELVVYLRRVRPDLVHTHCSVPGLIGRIAARLAGVPVVFHTVHGFAFHDGGEGLSQRLAIWAERTAGLLTDLLLSQNRSDIALAAQHRIVPPARIQFIGNGIDLGRFPVRVTPRVAGARTIITCVARMEGVKNHAMLFEAARMLHERGEAFELWLVGGGERRAAYEALCARWGLADVVRFLGYREDIPELLSRSDIGVLTSLKEGIPRAALESMAAGLPVVATRVTGTREVVRDGETGALVDVDDVAGLAAALASLIHNPSLRERWGARGRQVVAAAFDEADIVRNLAHAYHTQLQHRGRACPASLASGVGV